jgi:hypothetical protein
VNDPWLSTLAHLMRAPDHVPQADWDWVREQLGVELPPAHRQLVELYGPGTFPDITRIHAVVPGDPGYGILHAQRTSVDIYTDDEPYLGTNGHSGPDEGLLAWGRTGAW